MRSQTLDCKWIHFVRFETRLEVVDTPGLCDTHVAPEVIYKELGKSVAVASPGPHIILLALRCDRRFTDEEYQAYNKLKELFSKDMISYLIVIFNGMDELGDTVADQRKALKEEISKMPGNLQTVLKDAKQRYIGMNNKADTVTKSQLVGDVIALIKKTVAANGGLTKFYTTRLIFDINSMMEGLIEARKKNERVSHMQALQALKKDLVEEKEKEGLQQLEEMVNALRMHQLLMDICTTQ